MRRLLLVSFAAFGMLALLTSELEYSSGSPGGKTGSPGDGGANCTQCHSGTPVPAEGWITTNIPPNGYIAGETYTITVTGTHNGVGKFGFEATVENSENAKTGTLTITNAQQTKLTNGNQSVTHKSSGTTPTGNTKIWSFDWTAPEEAGEGEITIYAALNAANGNGFTTGDVIYLTSLNVPEYVTGLNENDLDNKIAVFPVPFTNRLNIETGEPNVKVELYSPNGQLILRTNSNRQTNMATFKTDNLKAGTYFVKIESSNGNATIKKVVKVK